jgi:secreted PhoX family phosphatase
MLTETSLHEKRHDREMRKRARRAGVTQDRINRHKHKWRLNREDLLHRREEAQAEAENAALKQTQRLVAAKQHTKAVEQPGGGLFRKLLNRVRGRG